jgi:hypothetical protein
MGKTKLALKLDLQSHDFAFCVELPIKAHKKNYKILTSTSHERPRIGGTKKVSAFRDGLIILKKMLSLFLKN